MSLAALTGGRVVIGEDDSRYIGYAEKVFPGGRVWGVGCGVWGFTGFEVANYLIFREKVPQFSP
jgi:hypothetical protein